jgi:NTF2 fold immunity protein
MYYFGPTFRPWTQPRQQEKGSVSKERSFQVAALTAVQLMAGQTMSQTNCDFLTIAEQYIAERFSSFDSTGKKPVIAETESLWELTYELPRYMLGGAPIITIDKRTCKVIRAERTQ